MKFCRIEWYRFRRYGAVPFFKSKHLDLLLCGDWHPGYQTHIDGIGQFNLDLLLVPGLMIKIRWSTL